MPRVPLVTAAAGCGGSGRELARFGDLSHLDAVHLGPVVARPTAEEPVTGGAPSPSRLSGAPGPSRRDGGAVPQRSRLLPTPSGLVHRPAPGLPVGHVVQDLLPWFRARGLQVILAVRGSTVGDVVVTLQALRRSLDFSAVAGVEVDLATSRQESLPAIGGLTTTAPATAWSADPQACLKLLAAAREQLPRDLLLLAKLGGECPDPVATARGAVGGGARALVLSGSVPAMAEGQHLVGPATAVITLGLVTRIRAAILAARVPDVPLVAVGGVRDPQSALAARAAGAAGAQLGSALFADPAVLWEVHAALVNAGSPGASLPDPPVRQHPALPPDPGETHD